MTVKTTSTPDNRYPEKPYDRFLYAGPTALSDAELLAIEAGKMYLSAISYAASAKKEPEIYGIVR